MARTSTVLLAMISLGSAVPVAQSPTPAQLEANKKVDHNVSGNEAFRRIRLAQAQAQAQAAASSGGVGRGAGAFALPQAPGSYYETFFWDTFRVRDGQLYEHRDAAVVAPGSTGAVPQGATAAGAGPQTIPIAWPPAPVVPAAGCTASPGEVEANKKAARAFFRPGITPEERIALVDASYVQHNPGFRRYALQNKISDYDAFKALIGKGGGRAGGPSSGAQGTPPPSVMADVAVGACDVVTLIHKNFRPDPTAPGSFYEAFSWDAFRVRNGKLVEHWDGATLPAP
jgi:predicted SnoaL-like aldol condensation-catalyzing enzyme